MQRLDRRLRILRGKKKTPFDPSQYAIERAARARAARRVRHLLRRMVPVVLHAPRWSEARAFLDDVGVDLGVRRPAIQCRTLALAPMVGRSVHDARQYLIRAIIELCELYVDGPVWLAVDRNGFRNVMRELLRRARTGPRRALLMHGVDHLHVEALADFVTVFEEHMEEFGGQRRLNVLLSGSPAMQPIGVEGFQSVRLPDYSVEEAIEALVEMLGPTDPSVLRGAIDAIGGVPALVEVVGRHAAAGQWITTDEDHLLQSLGRLGEEIRSVVSIACSDEGAAQRLDLLAREGASVREPSDESLLVAGLVNPCRGRGHDDVALRSPVFGRAITY